MALKKKNFTKEFENDDSKGLIFYVFCIWTFVLLCRPQDIFPILAEIRPALLSGVLTLAIVFLRFREIRGPSFSHERQVILYTALFFVMVFGIPFSLYRKLSFMTVFAEYINVILFFYIFFKVINSIRKLKKILLLMCLGNGLYLLFSLIVGSYYYNRLYFGKMFDPNDLAFFALSFLPLNLIFLGRENHFLAKFGCLACFGICVLIIILTGSRGGNIAFGFVLCVLMVMKSSTIGKKFKVSLILVCIIFMINLPANIDRVLTIFSTEEDYNITEETGRIAIWKSGWSIFLNYPLTGVGVGCFGEALGKERELKGLETTGWQAAHNMVVQIGVETGIFGLFLFLFLSYNVFRIFLNVRRSSISTNLVQVSEMGILGFLGLFISGMFLSQAYSLYWAFYVVISASVNQLLAVEAEV